MMAASGPVGVGFIGAGMISDTYLENLTSFPDVRVVILGDLDQQRAQAQAEKYDVPQWGSSDDVLTHPDVEIVVNPTIPAAHAEVASRAIAAGKHVWSEKPISVDRASGRALLEQAESAGLLVGVAPDTVLGPGVQTARRAIANGDIGVPLSAQTVMQYPGPDIFHPNPEFLFAKGAGPLFDIGPCYIRLSSTSSDQFPPWRPWARGAARRVPSRSEIVSAPSSRSRFPPTFPASHNSRVEG
jgi:predicted dehydrogenase